MKKKSILPLVTVTMLATALLGGCANKTESTTTTEATPTEAVKKETAMPDRQSPAR